MKKFGLGKGLKALIPEVKAEEEIMYIPVEKILPNPHQPRMSFPPESLEELASSIKEQGILQPILVRKLGDRYQLIVGERRYKAAIKAGNTSIPAIIKDYSPEKSLEVSLIENLQREDLNPLEKALAYKKLKEQFNYTQEELAKRLGKSRPDVANTLRLFNLSKNIQEGLLKKEITESHARALLSIEDENLRERIYQRITRKHISVRAIENLVKRISKGKKEEIKDEEEIYLLDIEEKLQVSLGTKVSIIKKGERGYLKIEFYSYEDLERVLEKIMRD